MRNKKWLFGLSSFLALLFLSVACEKNPNLAPEPELDYYSMFKSTGVAISMSDPYTEPLYAGQNLQVGEVQVWDDDGFIYVKFKLDDGSDWCLTETHLHVASSMGEVPQKNGNPIPGQFDYSMEHECISEYTYAVNYLDLGIECGAAVVIAAHAVVQTPLGDCMETVWQIGDVEVVNETTNWLENYADEFNWGDPAGPVTAGPSLAVEEPPFTTPFIVGTTPTEEFPYNSNYNRGYATNIDVQWEGALPYGGLLTVSWSPGISAQEMKVLSDGGIDEVFTATGTPVTGQGFFLDKYPLVEDYADVAALPQGVHTINFQHTKGDGTFWDWIRLEKPCIQEETAWGGTEEFPGNNWATYFVYVIQCGDDNGGGGDCQTETAWGGETAGGGNAWWFYFDASGEAVQPIWAGQYTNVGTVTYDGTNLTIVLTDDWELTGDEESVKIQAYDVIPDTRPAAGLFTTYKGTDLIVPVPAAGYYAIHLDVMLCPVD